MSADATGAARKFDGNPHCQWLKIVLVGDAGVGKTSLIKSLKNDVQSNEYRPTTAAWVTYFDLTESCRLLITDTSGRQKFNALVNLYLRNLHCVVFVFAFNEPSSFKRLNNWYQVFTQAHTGDLSNVTKFVVGTKIDEAQESFQLQTEAISFAKEIGAEMWITSAAKSFNTHELFTRIAENVSRQRPNPSYTKPVLGQSDSLDGKVGHLHVNMLDDLLIGKGALVRYPDPVLLDTDEEEISDLMLSYHCVTMTGQNRTFKWGTWSKRRSKEAVMRESSETSTNTRNKLWSCVMANAPRSTWQYENLEGVIKYGTTIRRQPTKTEFKSIKKLLFTSRDKFGLERNHGLFYMILQTEGSVLDIGLHSVFDKLSTTTTSETVVVENNFHLKPTAVWGQVPFVSMSSSHAAIVVTATPGDSSVATWGHGEDGALGLEQYLTTDFDPSTPTLVTSINCQVKQVACGADFTLMLTTEGKVYSCGSGAFGKLGHGDEKDKRLPTLIAALWNMQAIAAGGNHAAAITNGGFLYQWGQECADEQLTRFVSTPKGVKKRVISVSCGPHHTVIVGDGRIYSGIPYAWGRGTHGRLGLGHRRSVCFPLCINELYYAEVITQVSAGEKHTAFLTKKGEVYTCGSNAFGQLGYFTASGDSDVPRKVCLGKNATGDETRAKELCCNEDYTMILTRDDDVVVWGRCYYGPKLEDPIPIDINDKSELSITGVTTCNLPVGDSFMELVIALTNDSKLLFCAGMETDSDCQTADDATGLICCDKTNLTTLCSVESVVVCMDKHGNAYYADIGSWVSRLSFPLPEGQNTPERFTHALFSKLKDKSDLPPVKFTAITSFSGSIVAVETSLNTFLFCSNIGDVYSWSPMAGGHIVHHEELNSEVIVQIACGANHFAALSDEGTLFTCGDGRSGQLGDGTFQSVRAFQLVPLTEFDRVKNVCCGWASTSTVTENGKVYFWGQLDLPRNEKTKRKQTRIPSTTAPFVLIPPQVKQDKNYSSAPTGYKVEITSNAGRIVDLLSVVGRPFCVDILPRDDNTERSSRMEFRAETCNFQDRSQVHTKGTIAESQTTKGAFVASITFHTEGAFNVSITRNGQNVLGSPFKVNAERGVMMKECKLSLIGSDIESMRAVGGALQKAINARDSAIELWGVPSITADLLTQEALMLASMTDSGMYIYIWDANCASLAEENLNYWLYQLSLYAPSASVILLGVNLSAIHANEIDLKPFQKVNPQLKQSIFAGTTFTSEPGKLLDEVLLVVGEMTSCQKPVWHRFERLASKVAEKKKGGDEVLDEAAFKCLAGECGIHRDSLCREAAEHLEKTGVGLVMRGESFFIVLQLHWLARHLTEMAKSSYCGALDRNFLDTPKQLIVTFLIQKRLAFERTEKSTVHIVPYLSSIAEESWSLVDTSKYTIYRHLWLTVPPYHLHSIFRNLAASVVRQFDLVSLGKYSLVSYNDQYQFRIDCGPCVINKSVAEVRLTVRAADQIICSTAAEEMLSFLQNCFQESGNSYKFSVKASCSVCRQYYVDLIDVQEAAAQGETSRACGRCHGNKLSFSDLLNGFTETRPATELDWRPFHRPLDPGSPYSKTEIPSSDTLLRPLMRYFGDREERHGAKLLKEIKGMFESMTKAFMDMKDYDTPRTLCILPEFQRASVAKSNALKMLLTYGQPKYRLFLLCEGNGDGTGVHFLDYSKHKGYRLETSAAAAVIKESVELLRFTFQLLLSFSSFFNLSVGMGLFDVKDVEKTLSNVLGVVGLSGAMLCAVKWKEIFKVMDGFLKEIQECSGSIPQPKGLEKMSGVGVGCQVGGEKYALLRELLSELGAKDEFGGLKQEPRDGIGAIWVCEKHRKYNKETTKIMIMP